ncbi:hypothetical protein AB4Z30_14805 [Paenibacillus sp. 2TAF8]
MVRSNEEIGWNNKETQQAVLGPQRVFMETDSADNRVSGGATRSRRI